MSPPLGPVPAAAGPAGGASAASVFAVAAELIEVLAQRQAGALAAAGRLLAGRLMAGGTVYVFGTGHSRSVASELAGRAGGLMGIKEIVLEDVLALGLGSRDELQDGRLERRSEAAQALLGRTFTRDDDAFVIISHSGCNGAPVEMALEARRRGLPVVAITSFSHSQAVASRHPGGQRLMEVADVCIDTCAPYADTAIKLTPELGVCSVSSFSGVLIAQALTAEIVRCSLEAGAAPPLLVSRNLAGPA